jgi:NTE family protein
MVERIAVVLAAGGERVVPWETGVLAGLAEVGLDLRGAGAIVGTSAGAFVAARLALGADPREAADRIVERGVPEAPLELVARAAETLPRLLELEAGLEAAESRRRVGRFALEAWTIPEDVYVAAVARRLPSGGWPDALRVVAVDAKTGERAQLDARAGATVAAAVAAARALPGVLPAVTVGGRRLIDAVVASGTNADVARGAELVIVITPAAAEPPPGTVDAALEAGLAGERAVLEAAGATVHVIRADDRARAAMGPELFGIVDAEGAVASGRRAGRDAAVALLAAQINPSRAA